MSTTRTAAHDQAMESAGLNALLASVGLAPNQHMLPASLPPGIEAFGEGQFAIPPGGLDALKRTILERVLAALKERRLAPADVPPSMYSAPPSDPAYFFPAGTVHYSQDTVTHMPKTTPTDLPPDHAAALKLMAARPCEYKYNEALAIVRGEQPDPADDPLADAYREPAGHTEAMRLVRERGMGYDAALAQAQTTGRR